jgi:excisionase family DNA binding protein
LAGKQDRLESWSSVEDVSAHLGVVRDTIYRWIESRSLPAHRIGRIWKFKLSEVDDWVRAGGADEANRGTRRDPE